MTKHKAEGQKKSFDTQVSQHVRELRQRRDVLSQPDNKLQSNGSNESRKRESRRQHGSGQHV